jgi:hypothetical protein
MVAAVLLDTQATEALAEVFLILQQLLEVAAVAVVAEEPLVPFLTQERQELAVAVLD